MNLLGVEFENYASLSRQFVPLRSGINLLVGRNNSGKTAVLRALAAISGFFTTPASEPQLAQVLLSYKPADQPFVGINFIGEPTHDENIVLTVDGWWHPHEHLQQPKAIYRFRVRPGTGSLLFFKAELLLGEKVITFIETTAAGVFRPQYASPGSDNLPTAVQNRINLNAPGSLSETPEGFCFAFSVGPPPEFGFRRKMEHSRMVVPHRVVTETMQFQALQELSNNGSNLATYLATLNLNKRSRFRAIEKFVCDVFPEFESVNTPTEGNNVRITLTLRGSEHHVPLGQTGSGVEQLLALASLVEASPPDSTVYLDEPHSFLHPSAERSFVEFLNSQTGKIIVVSTHSSVFINSVEPERITLLAAPGNGFEASRVRGNADVHTLLRDLGYTTSDLLLYDRFLFGEGPTEPEILPTLLSATGRFAEKEVAATAFMHVEGVPENVDAQQKRIRLYERVLANIAVTQIPRMYLFDGDRTSADQNRLVATADESGTRVLIQFLKRSEIENYLLVPEAIAAAIMEEAEVHGIEITVSADDIVTAIDEIFSADDPRVFPRGREASSGPFKYSKGSVVLEKLFRRFGNLVYDKRASGKRIARRITLKNQPAIAEVAQLCESLFKQARVATATPR